MLKAIWDSFVRVYAPFGDESPREVALFMELAHFV
jgi:hypothetical protein